ncbi:LysR family transcriptional regulator [Bordetella genomosp. 8]|uniref:LysR family transcriptional regulator n=1 Tax=Bordetella genomosp. 8 TaxID=1416806 RepID=A0A1W6YJN9_9BORD|nr:LysR family transcriptional regulator [Bordetella genomosp. 8]ARP81189.1 LysR family transcriptional regulator [Bordetella genomosp. 8]
MELRHLRYFIAAAESGSIRIAAERIHVTQPAISRQIQDLEEELGLMLFERTPRGLKLTVAGQAYLREARAAIAHLEAAARTARRLSSGAQGYLRLGFVENSAWDGIVPDIFRRFQLEVPDVRMELIPMNTPDQLQQIEAGTLDGGFVYQYGPLPDAFDALPLGTKNVLLAAPLAWRLPIASTGNGDAGAGAGANAGKGTGELPSVALRDIADWPFVTFPRAVYPLYFDKLIGSCQELGVTLRVVQEVSTEAAMLALVCAGIGAAIVNSANLGRPPALARFARLSDLSIDMPLVFSSSKHAANPVLARFIDTVRDPQPALR